MAPVGATGAKGGAPMAEQSGSDAKSDAKSEDKGGPKGASDVLRLGLAAITAICVLGVVYLVQGTGQGFKLTFGDGGASVEVSARDSLESIVQRALDEDPVLATGDLAQLGFHSLSSEALADALRRIKPEDAEGAAVAASLREMLWDLKGPFALPGTLAGADKRLIGALEDLESIKSETGEMSELLAEIVLMSVDRRGLFQPRDFAGEVRRLPGVGSPGGHSLVYVCPGSPLAGKNIRITLRHAAVDDPDSAAMTIFPGLIVQDPNLMSCPGSFRRLTELLGGQAAQLGLDAEAFARLTAGAPPGSLPVRGLRVSFTVHPADYTKLVLPPT
ncbi:MAG: hypothetical protein ACFCUS_05530 [Rubrimonas sp.]|uniref:hypothetical protein n=1 Tax=Rubrimonas sp. TaxID=2036015 RepID=UPI002FDD8008